VNVEAAAATGGGRTDPLARLHRWALANRATLFVFAAAGAISTVRMLTWPPSLRQDQFVYTLTGQTLAGLHRPILQVTLTSTTPKPLASLLGLAVSPLPTARAWAAVVVLATATLAAAAFAYGRRVGGPLGAVVAVGGLALIPTLPPAMYGGEIDLVSAALLVLAVVSGPRGRVALMILLGLVRPLAWPLAGVAAFLAARGSIRRRAALGVAGTAAPALIWLANDAILYGSALTSYHANNRINHHVQPEPFLGAAERVLRGVWIGTGPVLFVIGLLGLAVAIWRRPWKQDPFPTCVVLGYAAALLVTWMRMRFNDRYALPLVAMWPLFAAHLASVVPIPRQLRAAPLAAAVCAAVVFGAAVAHMSQRPGAGNTTLIEPALDSAPAVSRVLPCGPVGVDVGLGQQQLVLQMLAFQTRHLLSDFRRYNSGLREARTQVVGPQAPDRRRHVRELRRKGWRSRPIPLGELWISPGCRLGG
jgi:hypothetical protein